MSEKIIKLTPSILKKIIQEEKQKLFEQAEKVKKSSKSELITEIKKLVSLRRKQRYLMQRLKNVQLIQMGDHHFVSKPVATQREINDVLVHGLPAGPCPSQPRVFDALHPLSPPGTCPPNAQSLWAAHPSPRRSPWLTS